jgi:hypothetical protein
MGDGGNSVPALHRVNEDVRSIVEGRDKPHFLRVIESESGWIAAGSVVRLLDVKCQGPFDGWRFEVYNGVGNLSLHVNRVERWELRPGDHVLLGGNSHVVMQIDKDFFGPNHERAGVRVREDGTGLEEWVGMRLDAITPVLGAAPAAMWARSEEGSDRKTETVGQVLDRDKTLAEALADDRRTKLAQTMLAQTIAQEEKKYEVRELTVQDVMTDGDRKAEGSRLSRLAFLRKEIPVAEKQLMAMKQELRKLVGAD